MVISKVAAPANDDNGRRLRERAVADRRLVVVVLGREDDVGRSMPPLVLVSVEFIFDFFCAQ
jgi:hypothetical protein